MRILKLILGGVVAVLSAFGTTITVWIALAIAQPIQSAEGSHRATGLGAWAGTLSIILSSIGFWFALFASFSIGFFLAYRKLYM